MRFLSIFSALVAALLMAATSYAGGPFAVDEGGSGVAASWPNGYIPWYSDPGEFPGYADNGAAVEAIVKKFDQWAKSYLTNADKEKVETAILTPVHKGKIAGDEDIDASNYEEHCFNDVSKKTCIIFDADGSITADWVDEKNLDGTLGLTQPFYSGSKITHGIVILNGLPLSKEIVSKGQYEAAMLHELGHLIGLDHTQINADIAAREDCWVGDDCGGLGSFIPTMFPDLVTEFQGILSNDDVVTLSWLSPNVDNPAQKFHGDFATITGEVFDKDGCFLKGVNVIAVRADGSEEWGKVNSTSMISGVMHPGFTGDGRYYLYGLAPKTKYRVHAEPIRSDFGGMSGFLPIEYPPRNFSKTVILTDGGEEEVTTPEAGKTVEMAAVTIDVTNPCWDANACPEDCERSNSSSSATTAKKMCSMVPGGLFDAASAMGPIAMLLSIGLIALRRKKG